MTNPTPQRIPEIEARISSLKQKRRSFKAQITMLNNLVNTYVDSASERVKLRNRTERLQKQFEAFVDAQDELANLEQTEDADLERERTTDAFDDAIANATVLLDSLDKPNHRSATSASLNGAASPTPTASGFTLPVHLPKIELPKFDGRIERWVTFKDAFQTMIHSQPGLTNIQKLQYLRLSLIGQAESVIDAFTITDDNYDAAWNQLMDVYDNKRLLVLRHATLLRDTPKMVDDSPEAIREFVNHIQLHIRSLQALGRTWEDIAGDFITSMMIARMATETRRAWERTLTDTEVPKATEILRHLRITSHQSKEADIEPRKRTDEYRDSPRHATPRFPMTKGRTPPPSTMQAAPSRWSPPSSRKTWQPRTHISASQWSPTPSRKTRQTYATAVAENCALCNNGLHYAQWCPEFVKMTVDQRFHAIKRAKRCENCLAPGHSSTDCQAGSCRVCNQRHHTMLHRDTTTSKTDGKN